MVPAFIELTFQGSRQAMNSRLENLYSDECYAEEKIVDEKAQTGGSEESSGRKYP